MRRHDPMLTALLLLLDIVVILYIVSYFAFPERMQGNAVVQFFVHGITEASDPYRR